MPIIENLSAAEYHADKSRMSSGRLGLIAKAPALFKWSEENPIEPTPAMRFGSLVHTAVLEPDVFEKTCVVAPVVDGRTKEGKAIKAEFEATSAGKTIITADELVDIKEIYQSIMGTPSCSKQFQGTAKYEVTVQWTDADTGIECRARPDIIRPNGVIVDLKTTTDASPAEFAKTVFNRRYHVQAAFYIDGLIANGMPFKGYGFIAVEKTVPYLCKLYPLSELFIELGRIEYKRNLATYAECLRTNTWPGYAEDLSELNPPAWAISNLNKTENE